MHPQTNRHKMFATGVAVLPLVSVLFALRVIRRDLVGR